jgi:SAM-dependent methyltransferase
LRQDIASRLAGGAPVSRFGVAVYAAYRPLTREAWVDDIPPVAEDAPEFSLLLLTQIAAPRRERELAQYIPRVTPITDHVSQGVRQQYEENPYPRWERLMVGRGTSKSVPVGAPEKRILVAGCGTGRHPLLTALAAPQCEVWAMDLSRPSLAYGMRRAQDYGIGNVRFVQGDILELGALTEVFDEISCGGVLHHLRDPAQGLAALRGRLADNGTLRLAIYTESGRQAVVAGIALRQDRGFAATPADIRRFRDIVFQLSKDHPAADLRASADFYTMSDCRDLVFHVQEHRFTLPRLEAMYTDAGFKLARFHPKPGNAAWFESTYPGRDPYTDLRTWAKVEAQRPGLFGSMYNIDLVKA